MKKYIAIATLLAAGSAFANAETWNIGTLTGPLMTDSSYGYILPEEIDSSKDWSISFDFSTDSLTAVGNEWGMVILSSQQNAFATTFSSAFQIYLKKDGDVVTKFNGAQGTEESLDVNLKAQGSVSVKVAHVTENNTLTISVGDKKATYSTNEVNMNDLVLLSNCGNDNGNATFSGNPTYKAPANATYKNVIITGTAIPEPSTFGLLAGLGALALVGTRRRRR